MLILNYGSTYFKNKVVLTKFISGCFYKSKNEEAKRGGKFAILPTLCCQVPTVYNSGIYSSILHEPTKLIHIGVK